MLNCAVSGQFGVPAPQITSTLIGESGENTDSQVPSQEILIYQGGVRPRILQMQQVPSGVSDADAVRITLGERMSLGDWVATECHGALRPFFISQERSHFLPVLQDMSLWKFYYIKCNCSSVLFRSTETLAFIVGDMLPNMGLWNPEFIEPYWGVAQISHPVLVCHKRNEYQ